MPLESSSKTTAALLIVCVGASFDMLRTISLCVMFSGNVATFMYIRCGACIVRVACGVK